MQSQNQILFYEVSRLSTIIRTEGIWKTYGIDTPRQVDAIQEVSLDIKEKQITALGGPSGSGKTTLLSIIGLLTKPSRGMVYIEDRELSGLSEVYLTRLRRNLIGFIFQAQYLIPQLTAIENVALPKVCTDMSRQEAEEMAKKKLIALGMEDRLTFRVAELSGGEQQRVSIARSLMNNPRILIADEPSSSIDDKLTRSLLDTLRGMVDEEGLTVVVASHDPVVLEWADIVYQLHDGSIIK